MRNVELSPLKSVYITIGVVAMTAGVCAAYADGEGFIAGRMALLLVGLATFCSGIFANERTLAQIWYWCIFVNIVCSVASIFFA
jgi:hypothetical protein